MTLLLLLHSQAASGDNYSGAVSVSGGGTVSESHTSARAGAVAITGGGSVTATGVREDPSVVAPVVIGGRYFPLRDTIRPERHSGTVSVHGGGSLEVVGSKHSADRVTVVGGGDVDCEGYKTGVGPLALPITGTVSVHGRKRYPQRIAHIIAMAA